jgi:hypothetical protein
MRLRVPKPKRTFLELDELRALIDAAASQDGAKEGQGVVGRDRHEGGRVPVARR